MVYGGWTMVASEAWVVDGVWEVRREYIMASGWWSCLVCGGWWWIVGNGAEWWVMHVG